MKYLKTSIKILILVLVAFSLSGCTGSKLISDSTSHITNTKSLNVFIDSNMKNDVALRLKDFKDSKISFNSEINNDTNIILTLTRNKIPSNWSVITLATEKTSLSPSIFNESFKNKFTNDISIYLGTKTTNDVMTQFLKDSFQKSTPKTTNITFLGDIMLSRTVEDKTRKSGNWNWPVLNIINDIKPTDLTVANLESPFSDPPKPFTHTTVFGADKKMVSSLSDAGIDIVSLANNHFGDSGKQGMNLTFKTLGDNNIDFFGADDFYSVSHKYKIREIDGIKFAFLGYVTGTVTPSSYASTESSPGLNLMNIDQMKIDVQNAKKNADFVIVSMHAGTEYTPDPNAEQKQFAHAAIEAGADMIYGHHPHVVEAIEIYQHKPIFYSLGNFIFDQEWSEETKEGLVLKTQFMYGKPVSFELMPVLIENYGQPEKATGKISESILNRIMTASAKLD